MDVLTPIGRAPQENFKNFLTAVRSPRGFVTERKRCEQLSHVLGSSPDDIVVLLSFLGGLYQKFRALEKSGSEFDELTDAFVEEVLNSDEEESDPDLSSRHEFLDVLRSRLKLLLAQDSGIDDSDKIARLKEGFVKSAVGFGAFVDLRPDFRDKFKSVKCLIPMVQLRILTNADDISEREFVFQCDPQSLQRLRELIADTEEKIQTLSNHAVLSQFILNEGGE